MDLYGYKNLIKYSNVIFAYRNGTGDEESVKLDAAFTNEILACIDIINNTPASLFKAFKFVKPSDSIHNYIDNNSIII